MAAPEKPVRSRSHPGSFELLRDQYQYDSLVLIYQVRLQELFWRLVDLADGIGMQVRVQTKLSRERVHFRKGSVLIIRPVPKSIPDEAFRKFDEIFAASRDKDHRVAARFALMLNLELEERARPYWSGFAVLAREQLGRATSRDKEAARKLPERLVKEFEEALAQVADRADWLEHTAQFSEAPNPQSVMTAFAYEYPEYGSRLTEEHVSRAMAVWVRRGGGRPNKRARSKWEEMAAIMHEIGLGPIGPKSLQSQWIHQYGEYRQLAEFNR